MPTRTRTARLVAVVLAAFLLVACAGDDDGPQDEAQPPPEATEPPEADEASLEGELVVLAAASLTDAFDELGATFEEQHHDLTVTFNFASSSTLATQIVEGSPADVFASADQTQMDVVDEEGLADPRVTLTTNLLEIAVEEGNPLDLTTLDDLSREDIVLVLAAPEVPAGQFAAELLEEQGVEVTPSSLEVDVRATLGRVELGEADAAIVYRSDVVTAADTVEGVEIPEEDNVVADYPIATLTGAANPDVAAAWVEFTTGPEGQAALEAAGFTAP